MIGRALGSLGGGILYPTLKADYAIRKEQRIGQTAHSLVGQGPYECSAAAPNTLAAVSPQILQIGYKKLRHPADALE